MKKIVSLIVIIIVIILLLFFGFNYFNKNEKEDDKVVENTVSLIDIKNNYNTSVSTVKDTALYTKDENKYLEIGKVYKNTSLELEKVDVLTIDNEYFKINGSPYYVYYKDVTPSKKLLFDDSYKNYLPYDEKIITKDNINYYFNGVPVLKFNKSLNLKIIMKDNNMYYIEFLGRLMSVRKDDIINVVKDDGDKSEEATKIAVLNYHFFYDPVNGEKCNESICLEKSKFEEQLTYLQSNSYYTLSMNDFNLWMDKKIRLPKKSVLITVDDGAMGTNTHLIQLLEKYNMKGTLFLITAWWPSSKYVSNNLELQSHGNDIHVENYCTGVSRGAKGLCLNKEEIIKDLTKSVEKLNGEKLAFCYPFYLYNTTMVESLKEVGFSLAFVGGNKKATRNDDKYKVPRYIIYYNTSMEQFKKIVN